MFWLLYKARFLSAAIKRLIFFPLNTLFAIEIGCYEVNSGTLVLWPRVQRAFMEDLLKASIFCLNYIILFLAWTYNHINENKSKEGQLN